MYFLYSQHIELLSMLQQLQSVCAVVSPVNPYVSTQNSSDAGASKRNDGKFLGSQHMSQAEARPKQKSL